MKKFAAGMTFTKHLIVLFILNSFQNSVHGRVLDRTEIDENIKNVTSVGSPFEKSLLGDFEEKNLQQEILQELNHLSFRKQREIFVDLEKQHEKFNATQKSLVSSESEILSPLTVEELKNIRKTIKSSNSSLPAIRNKRTLNLLLSLVARAMGYTLTPSNPDAEWIPRQQPQPSAQPCGTPPPPCRPSPSTPPPCAMPPTAPPCQSSGALMQPATVPPNQINANTISYPYRPARTIPLFNFAPLPAGIRVPYPPLLQPPAQQRSPCTPQQPSPSPCGTPAPSPPPCGTTPAPGTPPPCQSTPPPSPSPCGTPPPPPPCGTTPAPSPPPCATPAPQPPPCSTPAPKPQPCATTPAPPPPCGTPAPPPCNTPAPSPPPCNPPSPPPCGSPAAPPPKPKKGSIVLEYDDPVRIQIFSNDKKYLPASGRVYNGDYDDQQQDWHSHFFPTNEKTKNTDEDFEEEEMHEHIEEEEEEDGAPGQLKHYEEEDERTSANNEDEEDESETNLSVVKKPLHQDNRKTKRRKEMSSKTNSVDGKKNEKEESAKYENKEKTQKMKKPKKKKWVRIVKKQRRKTKTDLSPQDSYQVYTSDSVPEGSQIFPEIYGESVLKRGYHSYDASDYSNDSGSQSSEDLGDFKKVTIKKKQIHTPEMEKAYEFNINPYAHALEPEEARRAKLEKAVERYVEDYVEKQLGQELIKNTGIPKTTVFEFAPKNGPKIQTITTTVAKSSHSGPVSAKAPTRLSTNTRPNYRNSNGNAHIVRQSNYEQNLKKRGNTYEAFTRKF